MNRADKPLHGQTQVPDAVQEELRRLGSVLQQRADGVIEAVTSRAHREREREGAPDLDAAVEEQFVRLGALATVAVAHWLGGEPPDVAAAAGEEFSRVFARLAAVSDVSLGEVVRRCRCWREGCERELSEAGGDGPIAEEALGRACESIRTAADRALAQMSSIFDAERQHVKAELSFLATHDGLTKLANRSLIKERLERMLARSARQGNAVAVLFIDLDDFKVVNDTLGHGAGDELLVAVAERLGGAVRDTDTLGRLGGDEFVVLAECAQAQSGPGEVAARLSEALAEPFAVEGRPEPLRLDASIGVASAAARSSMEQLLCDADIAMYSAKRQGGGCVRYEPGMAQALVERTLRRPDGPAGGAGDGAQGVGSASTP